MIQVDQTILHNPANGQCKPPLRLVEPPPERRISAGWMRDYDRAQALMAADLKVQRVWPGLVEGGV